MSGIWQVYLRHISGLSQVYLRLIPNINQTFIRFEIYCQTLGLVLRLRVDFVLPLSQEQQEEEEPLTKIYLWGVY